MDEDEQLSVVSTVWPAISQAELEAVCRHLDGHGSTNPPTITWRSARPMASACLAALGDGTEIFVKRYSPTLISAEELLTKHAYVGALVSSGFPTVPFLNFSHGNSVIDLDSWRYEISLRATGEDRYRETYSWQPPHTDAQARELGRLAARLRLASAAVPAAPLAPSPYQTRVRLVLGDPVGNVGSWLAAHPGVESYVKRTGRKFTSDVAVLAEFGEQLAPFANAPMCWTHGDLHVSNTLWEGDRITNLIDFGLASVNPPLVDLALAIERHAIDWVAITAGTPGAFRPQVAHEIISGYQEVAPLSPSEADALPALIAVCQAEFALAVIEYGDAAPVPASNADWAYDIYFNGHNKWFASDDGRRFADEIRRAIG